jgi:putative ABC transport system permease protein
MNKDYLILAGKNLKHRGVRSWLTLLGIFIGVTAVISLIGLGSGLKLAVVSQFGVSSTEVINVQAGGILVGAPGTGVSKPLTQGDAEAIEKLSSVELAIGRLIETIKIKFNNIQIIGSAFSIESGESRKFDYEMQGISPLEGRLLRDGDSGQIMLGYNFFLEGDENSFKKKIVPGDKIEINGKSFRVVGIIEKKGSFIIDNAVMMNKEDLKELVGNGENVDIISVKVKNKDLVNRAEEEITELLRKRRDVKEGEEDFKVSTPEATLATVNSILGGIQIFIIIIASISIVVGAIGIINTMTTSVMERKKEIGIMKAIGARNEQIFLQFFIEAGLLGLVGGITGIIFGETISILGIKGIGNFLGTELTPDFNWLLIILALVGSFLIGAVSGILPAMKAARQNPVEVLR